MVDLGDATRQVQNVARMFRPLMQLSETLEKMGSLEQAQKEAVTRTDKAKSAALEAEAQLASVSALVEDATTKAGEILTDAGARSDKALMIAQSSAEQIVADAKTKSVRMVNEATLTKMALDTEIGRLKAEAATLTQEVNAKGEALRKLKTEMSDLVKKLG